MTEVRDVSTGGKGLFATKDYKIGDVILKEASPLFRLDPLPSDLIQGNLQTSPRPKVDPSNECQPPKVEIVVPESVDPALHSKFRSMVQVVLTSLTLDDATVSNLTSLYTPNLNSPSQHETSIVKLSHTVLDHLKTNAVPKSPLETALKERSSKMQSLMLVWACNAFAGGRLYETFSRINHSCNPNAIVQLSSDDSDKDNNNDTQILQAATPIRVGDPLTISYLPGLFLYADTSTRRARLTADKFFQCVCLRCTDCLDCAWTIPCPQCHPRHGRCQLGEDVQYDDDQVVHYVSDRSLSCSHCGFTTTANSDALTFHKNQHETLLKTCRTVTTRAVDYLLDRERYDHNNDDDDDEELQAVQREQLEQHIRLVSSVLGARHWTTNMLLLLQLQHYHLHDYHASILDHARDNKIMDHESALESVAQAIDTLQRLVRFVEAMRGQVQLHMGHLLSDVVIGTARALVSLGDVKSQSYAAEWLAKIDDDYVQVFETDAIKRVVQALGEAHQRTRQQQGSEKKSTDNETRPEKRLKK